MDTTYFQRVRARLSSPDQRRALSAASIGAVAAAVLLAGCGQNFEQDGGALPVPRSSSDELRVSTPEANPDAPAVVGPGYAPPHSAGPTQTAVPNLPGGKL